MDQIKLFARIFSLLESCSVRDFEKASRSLESAPDLSRALEYLARYKQTVSLTEAKTILRAHDGNLARHTSENTVIDKYKSSGLEKRLYELVFSKRLFRKNDELIKHLRYSGFGRSISAKDSRQRIYSKLKSELKLMSPDERARKLERVFSLLPSSTTAGWFNAILK